MSRLLLLLIAVCSPVFCQSHFDWKAQFEAGANPDEAVRSKARETGYVAFNRLCEGKPDFVAQELSQIAEQLESNNPEIKVQASGVFSVLNLCRQDTQQLFSGLYPAFVRLAQSNAPILARANGIRAIAESKPQVPTGYVDFFKQEVDTGNRNLAGPAIYGLLRAADREPEAVAVLHGLLINPITHPGTPDFRLSVLKSMQGVPVKSAILIRDFNVILASKDRSIVLAALDAIARIGKPAIEDNQIQLNTLTHSDDAEIRGMAAELLKRLTR